VAAERILAATQSLIAEHGPASATISQIAERAGVGRQTIYRWWPTRPALVIDALVAMTDAAMPFRSTGEPLVDLRRQMRSMVRTFAGPTGALIKELVAEAQGDPEVAAAFRERFFDHRRQQARAFLAPAVGTGVFGDVADLDAFIYGLYAPLWLALLVGNEPLDRRLADRALDVWLQPGGQGGGSTGRRGSGPTAASRVGIARQTRGRPR
jgi:AcrR family transcriptional regulator